MGIKSVKDLKVYNAAFELAMEIFKLTQAFPKEEQYSLTDQMRRSSFCLVFCPSDLCYLLSVFCHQTSGN
jgi:hypothetical protein